jgi:hypothetical protein
MSKIAIIFSGAALYGALTVTTVTAAPIAPVSTNAVANVEQVRWVCGPNGRCWWRPNYYWRHATGIVIIGDAPWAERTTPPFGVPIEPGFFPIKRTCLFALRMSPCGPFLPFAALRRDVGSVMASGPNAHVAASAV